MAPDLKNMVNSISTANIFGEGTVLPCTWKKSAANGNSGAKLPPPPPSRHFQKLLFDTGSILRQFKELPTVEFEPAHTDL